MLLSVIDVTVFLSVSFPLILESNYPENLNNILLIKFILSVNICECCWMYKQNGSNANKPFLIMI